MSCDMIAVGVLLLVLALAVALLALVRWRPARLAQPSGANPIAAQPDPGSSTWADPYLGLPDTHVIASCPRIHIGDDHIPLRDWMKNFAGDNAWPNIVTEFYRRAATHSAIADYFTGIDMERLQRHFLAALMIVTGQGVTVGVFRRMRASHRDIHNSAGSPITDDIWDATATTLLDVLADRAVPPEALASLLSAMASLRAAIVPTGADEQSDPR